MAETVIVGEDSGEEGGTAAESAHQAAVAEGATAVQAEQAEQAAAQAAAAAEVALAAAEANIETAITVEDAVATAEGSAAAAMVSAEMVHEALQAQTAAITALTEELKRNRESAPKEKPASSGPPADTEPATKAPWYYREIGS